MAEGDDRHDMEQQTPRGSTDIEDEAISASTGSGGTSDLSASIRTPGLAAQHDLLARAPPMTQLASLKKGVWTNMRKPRGHVDIEHTFKHIFKKSEFKGKQREIMDAAVRGFDILAIAPTGMGKSICFQVPAVAEEHGVTIVVTPLLSLMENQVDNLRKLRVKCAMLSSKTDAEEVKLIKRDLRSGHPKNRLLYVTPERLATTKFRDLLKVVDRQGELARLVIDEAHCISEWGHDFRKEYQQIGEFRRMFPRVPIMALTASATREVRNDIILSLDLCQDQLYHVVHSFNRINLYYEVRFLGDNFVKKLEDIATFITKLYRRKQLKSVEDLDEDEAKVISGIIYCRKKDTCDQVAAALRNKGISAAAYHRGLSSKACDLAALQWRDAAILAKEGKKRVDVIVATVAFGMGIDAPACRYVIHWDLPTSFEGYYQETGRAGRDGHASRCVLYYSRGDAEAVRYMAGKAHTARQKKAGTSDVASNPKKSIDELIKYAENVKQCRHVLICRYFDEKPDDSMKTSYCDKFCDVCRNPEQVAGLKDTLEPQEMVMTQMPRIQDEAEQEWDEADENASATVEGDPRSRSATVEGHDLEDNPPPPVPQGLPGFAKASEFSKKRPLEGEPDDQEARRSRRRRSDTITEVPEDQEAPHVDDLREAEQPFTGGAAHAIAEHDEERVWIPKKRINRELSRTNSVQAERNADGWPGDVQIPPAAELETWPHQSTQRNHQVHDVTITLDTRSTVSSVRSTVPVISPPRAPVPKASTAAGPSKFTSVVAPKQNLLNRSGTQLEPSANAGRTSIVAPRTNLSGGSVVVGAVKTGWQAPFKKSHARVRVTNLQPLEESGQPVARDLSFVLSPARWDKPIPKTLREDAVKQIHTLVARSTLSDAGVVTRKQEDAFFTKTGLPLSEKKKRAAIVLYIALEAESEVFWLSITSAGYADLVGRRIDALKGCASILDIIRANNAGHSLENLSKAVTKAVKWRRVHESQQKRTSLLADSLPEDDDDESDGA